jgi:hypothetical protein
MKRFTLRAPNSHLGKLERVAGEQAFIGTVLVLKIGPVHGIFGLFLVLSLSLAVTRRSDRSIFRKEDEGERTTSNRNLALQGTPQHGG